MSASPPRADMLRVGINVCFVPIADIDLYRVAVGLISEPFIPAFDPVTGPREIEPAALGGHYV